MGATIHRISLLGVGFSEDAVTGISVAASAVRLKITAILLGCTVYSYHGVRPMIVRQSLNVLVGKPVVKGTRIPVELALAKLAATLDIQELFQDYPRLTSTLASRLPSPHVYPRLTSTLASRWMMSELVSPSLCPAGESHHGST